MARKSRRNKEEIEVKERVLEILNERKIKVGGYVRLSNDRNDTDSIETQTLMIRQYVNEHPEMEIGDFYVDDGFSGTNFARPGIVRLIDDVKSGKIDCIIVKDFSRFGRNYIEVGYYLETVFPCLGVRFISINDRYDSSKEEDQSGLSISIKNLLNSMYAVDISKKLSRAFELQRQTGTVKYKRPIFGYEATKDKLSLIVDPVAARTVKLLFYWYSRGYSTSEMAKKLNILQFNTPWDYLKEKYHYNERANKTNVGWRTEPILCILRNQEYIGNKVNGKLITRLTETPHATRMPPDKWHIEENAHEAIISRRLFDSVNEKMAKTRSRIVSEKASKSENRSNYDNILWKRVMCGDCGRVMSYYRKGYYCYGLQEAYYSCSTGKKGENDICHHVVYEDFLNVLLLDQMKGLFKYVAERRSLIEPLRDGRNEKSVLLSNEKKLVSLKKKEQDYENVFSSLYLDLSNELISPDEYNELSKKFHDELRDVQKKIKQTNELVFRMKKWIDAFEDLGEKLSDLIKEEGNKQKLIDELIEKVVVFKDGRVEIVFACADVIERFNSLLEEDNEADRNVS